MLEHVDGHQEIGCAGIGGEVVGVMKAQAVAGLGRRDGMRLWGYLVALQPGGGVALLQLDENLAGPGPDLDDTASPRSANPGYWPGILRIRSATRSSR
jgi:hypothetical protein